MGYLELKVCMPADLTQLPWRATRSRQDFTEDLYLNISLSAYSTPGERGGLYKISLGNTAGYFELPNYMNGQQPGKLLHEDPGTHNLYASKPKRDVGDISVIKNSTLAVESMANRGPLATIALALFGSGSFIADRLARPEAYIYPYTTYEQYQNIPNCDACVGLLPVIPLVQEIGGNNRLYPYLTSAAWNHDNVQRDISEYIRACYIDYNYLSGGDGITKAFTSAAFFTNEAWLLSTSYRGGTWSVSYDLGADNLVPVISTTEIISVSVLPALFLIVLIALALYSALTPRWTDQLDAFAMLRLGASIAEEIQLRRCHEPNRVDALDGLNGWIGDETGGEEDVGQLGLGAHAPLADKRSYVAYAVESRHTQRRT